LLTAQYLLLLLSICCPFADCLLAGYGLLLACQKNMFCQLQRMREAVI